MGFSEVKRPVMIGCGRLCVNIHVGVWAFSGHIDGEALIAFIYLEAMVYIAVPWRSRRETDGRAELTAFSDGHVYIKRRPRMTKFGGVLRGI